MELFAFVEKFMPLFPAVNSLKVSGACCEMVAYCVVREVKTGAMVVLLVSSDLQGLKLEDYINNIMDGSAKFLPAKDLIKLPEVICNNECEHKRLKVLADLKQKTCKILIVTPESLQGEVVSKELFGLQAFNLNVNDAIEIQGFKKKLVEIGYKSCEFVESVGQFAARGGIVDIYSPGALLPVRVELFDGGVNSISEIDIFSNRRTEKMNHFHILPAREQNAEGKVWDYLSEKFTLFVFDAGGLKEKLTEKTRLNNVKKVMMVPFDGVEWPFAAEEQIDALSVRLQSLENDFSKIWEEVQRLHQSGLKCLLLVGSENNKKTMIDFLAKSNCPAGDLEKAPAGPWNVWVSQKNFPSAFKISENLAVLTVLNWTVCPINSRLRRTQLKRVKEILSLADLTVGDKIVHRRHGVGIFDGFTQIEVNMGIKDYIKLEYAGGDALYLPATQLDSISKYVGSSAIKLHKLNGKEWGKIKEKIKKSSQGFARELFKIYAQRAQLKGHSFKADTKLQIEFERAFDFEDTEDQRRCVAEIKKDMESCEPMDRFLCGDVGVGKTEVALRAAFKCAIEGKQVVMIAPTTILVWQHFSTALARFNRFPVRIEFLSRFKSPKEQKEILKLLRNGEIDMIIGTHRLLQKDVGFADIGLVIIDEEQRFGVKHKEQIKKLCQNVDVLSISATPIPRTLNMTLIGIRDISVIETLPQNRFPVKTLVMEYNEEVIKAAINAERKRGGQIFFLCNQVNKILHKAQRLQEILGDSARIAVAHGQMSPEIMQKSWQKLLSREVDILVCTTIIENGIDIPNCNTLIVEDAQNFGLAQLHQLRGRVGRSNCRGFVYMFFRKQEILSTVARQRLEALKEFAEFGAGLKISHRDLAIRGAGNVLGEEQHGHMNQVGYDMYMALLNEAIAREGGVKAEEHNDCLVDVNVNAFIPLSYIEREGARLAIYKKIAGIKTEAEIDELKQELVDIYGKLPTEIECLFDVMEIKNAAKKWDICELKQYNEMLNVIFKGWPNEQVLMVFKKCEAFAITEDKIQQQVRVTVKIGKNTMHWLKNLFFDSAELSVFDAPTEIG
ncbi:MAG: transcription-repair coupling factor [Oscillospiraceae bacterium]|jgi:transcription-repair coupling factor|nr:transcription-repair coupling factor [Oscillospiraceae bacterium]